MAEPNIGTQFKRLLALRCGLVEPPREKLGLAKALPTLCIERVQVNGSAAQCKSFVKAAQNGCRGSRKSYNVGISRFESNRPLNGSIRSSPIEVDLLLNPRHLDMGLCQVRVQRERSLNCFTRKPVTFFNGNNTYVGLPVAYARQPDPSRRVGGIKLNCSFIIPRSHVRIFFSVPLKEVVSLQVGVEGFPINWAWPR